MKPSGPFVSGASPPSLAFHSYPCPLDSKITHLESTVQQLYTQNAHLVQILHIHEQKHECEALYAGGRTVDAAVSLLEIKNTMSEQVRANKFIMDWLAGEFWHCESGYSTQLLPSEFTTQCITTLEIAGDHAFNAGKCDEAVALYSTALLLCPSTPNTLLIKWARMVLIHGSANDALTAATEVCFP